MRTVEVSRFIREKPPAIAAALDPVSVVEYEGSFEVRDVADTEDGRVVTVGSRGLAFALAFEPIDDGLAYEQHGDGPLETMRTTITYAPEDEGTRVVASSEVAMGRWPAVLADRIAAWKRKGELKRLLRNLEGATA